MISTPAPIRTAEMERLVKTLKSPCGDFQGFA